MKIMTLLAGAAALAFAADAGAKPGHGQGASHQHGYSSAERDRIGYGVGGCPRGLAKKNNRCQPPGQARKLARGQHWRDSFGSRYAYRQIPSDLRQRYDLDPRDRYYYDNGSLYQVDPRTMLVEQVISALLGRR